MTRISTNARGLEFRETDSQLAGAAHMKAAPAAAPTPPHTNVVDEFVSGGPSWAPPSVEPRPTGKTFSAAALARMSPAQRAQTVGAGVVPSAVYPPGEEEKYPLKHAEFRQQLVATVTQYNDVSAKTLNGPDICAACSVVNAMVLSDDGKASAAALRRALKDSGAALPAPMTPRDAERALTAFASGEVSEFDVAVLQQVAAAVLEQRQGVADQQPGAAPGPGISEPVLRAFVADLVRNGAPLKRARFELSQNADGAHWTTTVRGTHADSAPPRTPRTELRSFTA